MAGQKLDLGICFWNSAFRVNQCEKPLLYLALELIHNGIIFIYITYQSMKE